MMVFLNSRNILTDYWKRDFFSKLTASAEVSLLIFRLHPSPVRTADCQICLEPAVSQNFVVCQQ